MIYIMMARWRNRPIGNYNWTTPEKTVTKLAATSTRLPKNTISRKGAATQQLLLPFQGLGIEVN